MAIESLQQGYGYNQNLGIFEQDYIDGSGQSYEGVYLRTAAWK